MAKNAIDLLSTDHRQIVELLTQLVATTRADPARRSELVGRIKRELLLHATLEEEIFYPVFRESGRNHERIAREAHEEHRAVEKLALPDLETTDPASDEFRGRAKVLRALVVHHVGEEELEIFPRAERALSGDELERVATQLAQRRRELAELL